MSVTTRESQDTAFQPPTVAAPPAKRIAALDIVRGVIMVLMAIDHVRVYAGVPAGGPTPGVFFTRWVTHFSAPGFAFLAGTGAFLYARKSQGKADVATFLATRGLFLVLLELTVMRLAWTFNVDVGSYNLAGVLWMLGWCMVLMAGLVWLPTSAVGIVGLAVIFAQFVFGPISHALPSAIGKFLYLGGQVRVGTSGPPIDILYVVVPWIGVMAAGYAFGAIMTREAEARRVICLKIGITATAAFLIVAWSHEMLNPTGLGAGQAFLRMLNQRKYPASPMFLLMTLGPTILFIPYADRLRGLFGKVMETFGRVPLFFYVLHIPLIHATACVVSLAREGRVDPWLFGNHPLEPPPVPEGYRWSLWLLYLVFAIVVALLYPVCRWYMGVKARDTRGWTKYL